VGGLTDDAATANGATGNQIRFKAQIAHDFVGGDIAYGHVCSVFQCGTVEGTIGGVFKTIGDSFEGKAGADAGVDKWHATVMEGTVQVM
jgi:hypothetical protein